MAQEQQGVVLPWGQLTTGRSVMGSRLSGGLLVRRRGWFRRCQPSSEGRGRRSFRCMVGLCVGWWGVGFVVMLVGFEGGGGFFLGGGGGVGG